MLKVLAAVLAVLSAAISITIYTATLPDIQKQSADNAEAIETLGGSVSDNAEAIETLGDDINILYGLPATSAQIVDDTLIDDYSKDRLAAGRSIMLTQAVYEESPQYYTCNNISSNEPTIFTNNNVTYYFLIFRLSNESLGIHVLYMLINSSTYNITISNGYTII